MRFTKLEIVLLLLILLAILTGFFIIYTKSTSINKIPFLSKMANLEKFPETSTEWSEYMGDALDNYCQNDKGYDLKPEFRRSLSLIIQRLNESPHDDKDTVLRGVRGSLNCLDINYASTSEELSGADGIFLFSKEFSNNKRLSILVNPDYKAQDDLMTAMLLSHEIVHADQFIYQDVYNTAISTCYEKQKEDICNQAKQAYSYVLTSCYDSEINAFGMQFYFFLQLKESEKASLLSKYLSGNTADYNLPVLYLMENYSKLVLTCGNDSDATTCAKNWFTAQVTSSPFYQKQCGAN